MVLVKEAGIYIFDEPLAGIDIGSKEKVMSAIFKHTEDKILIVIMHGDEKFHISFDRKIDLEESKTDSRLFPKNALLAGATEPENHREVASA